MRPKVKRIQGIALMKLVANGDVDLAITFASEINDTGVDVVGQLPKGISTPTGLVGFISSHSASPDAARAVLKYLSSPDADVAYQACGMKPGQ